MVFIVNLLCARYFIVTRNIMMSKVVYDFPEMGIGNEKTDKHIHK